MSFKVSIENGKPKVLLDDYVPETDIIELLSFDENQIEDLFRDHAAIQARWEQLAINSRNEFERFDEEFVKKWFAHNKQFARLALAFTGTKNVTIDSIRDTTILIYSRDTATLVKEKYGDWAFQAALKEKSVFLDKAEDKEAFFRNMFKYLESDPQWFYEDLVKARKDLEKVFQTLQNVAKRLEARSFHMKDLKDLISAKHGNIGPMSYKEKNTTEELERAIAQGKLKR
ncbi:hypothetical protein N8Z24_00140 [bacterium]|nr:hypothetical protein [bacterium]